MSVFFGPISAQYSLAEEIGSGATAIVRRGIHRETGESVAVKVIEKAILSEKAAIGLQTEISILTRVNHPNIISLKAVYDDSASLFIVTELVTGGELFAQLARKGGCSELESSHIIRKIILATEFLHSQGIVHRDLKPENLLLADTSLTAEVKLADFGLAKILWDEDQLMYTTCGTPSYVAPEVLEKRGYDRQCDVWSIGVIMYILLCGYPPFWHENIPALLDIIVRGHFEFSAPAWTMISQYAQDLIRMILVVDPRQRYTTQQCLAHPWLSGEVGLSDAVMPGHLHHFRSERSPAPARR